MNEVIKAIEERRSTRSYKPDAVPKELIEQVMEAGTWTASGMGRQSPIIVAVTDRALRDRLSDANRRIMGGTEGTDPFYGAPVVLVVLASKDVPTHVYDGSLVLGTMMLAAESLGLGSCWIHRAREEFEQPEFRQVLADLGVSGAYEGIGHLALGYVDRPTPAKPRNDGRILWAE